jgi:hypothetical protein
MMLTVEEIRILMEELAWETVLDETNNFRYRIQRRGHGYSERPEIGRIQAALSIMLEAKLNRNNP